VLAVTGTYTEMVATTGQAVSFVVREPSTATTDTIAVCTGVDTNIAASVP
jgi:hypothetical protein